MTAEGFGTTDKGNSRSARMYALRTMTEEERTIQICGMSNECSTQTASHAFERAQGDW